jgi:hypothetical protein
MPAPLSVDAPGTAAVIEERDLDARLVMLIVAARVTSALEEMDRTAEPHTKTVIPCSGMCTDGKGGERLAPIT